MSAVEMATVLRVALPLAKVPQHAGKRLKLSLGSDEAGEDQRAEVWAQVEADGAIHSCTDAAGEPNGQARGLVKDWIPVILDDDRQGVVVDTDQKLLADALGSLYEALWSSNTPGSDGAGQ